MSTKEEADITYIVTHARSIIKNLIWPEGPTCPYCGSHSHTKQKDGRYYCKSCSRKYSIKLGTIFEKSHLPLSKWLIALYLMLTNNGISSPILARYIHVTQPTAFYMMMKLRFLFSQEETALSGEEIAVDELYVGGTWSKFSIPKKNKLLDLYMLPKHPKTTKERIAIGNRINSLYKTPVLGINDGTNIVLKVMPKPVIQEEVLEIFKHHVEKGSHTVSDCSTLYDSWHELTGCTISHNNHSKQQYKAEDGKSSNKIEGTFSQYDRQTLDKHCSISPRLLQLYLDEHSFRFNTRKLSILKRFAYALRKVRQKVTVSIMKAYDSLNGKKNNIEIFNPYEFFSKYGTLFNEYIDNGVVYRRLDYIS